MVDKRKDTESKKIQQSRKISQDLKLNNQTKKKTQKSNKKIIWKDIKSDKRVILISFIVLIFIIYCVCKVVALIQNPTDTFTVEQGKIYQEESTTRIYY